MKEEQKKIGASGPVKRKSLLFWLVWATKIWWASIRPRRGITWVVTHLNPDTGRTVDIAWYQQGFRLHTTFEPDQAELLARELTYAADKARMKA